MKPSITPVTPLPGETIAPTLSEPSFTATFTSQVLFTHTPQPTSICPPPQGWSPIKVQPGETLGDLAINYNTSEAELMQANCLLSNILIPGTILYVPGISPSPTETVIPCGPPPSWVQYTVQAGDTLYQLGLYFGVTVAELQFANCMGNSTIIRTGQVLFVPFTHLPPTATATLREPTNPLPSSTPSPSPTDTPVPPTNTPEPTWTFTPVTPLPTPTATNTPQPTRTRTSEPPNATTTSTSSITPTASHTPSETVASSPTATSTPTPTSTPTFTPTIPSTSTPTITPTTTPTFTPTPTETNTLANKPTLSATDAPQPTLRTPKPSL